jgi:hypothetical protein
MAPPVAGYVAWWDASQITSPPADGAVLSSWNDLSGNGHTLTQATTASKPTYYSTTTAKLMNGLPAVWFNGSATEMDAALVLAQPFTVVAWCQNLNTGSVQGYVFEGQASAVYVRASGTGLGFQAYAGNAFVVQGPYDTSAHYVAAVYNGASSSVTVDTATTTGNAGANGITTTLQLGANNGSFAFNGPICEVIVYPSALSGANITALNTYLAGKWKASPTVTGTAAASLGPLTVTGGAGAVSGCARAAWLVLGAAQVALEDHAKGYFCAQLDLGYPAVREVVSNRPDRDGITDRTALMGSRVVSANITAVAGAGAVIDAVAALLAPYMAPGARPVLHYVLDRPGHPERTLTLRGAGYSWPIAGGSQRDIQLQWVAADPIARDPAVRSATVAATGTTTIVSPGDVPVRPVLRIIGPITGPAVTLTPTVGPVWVIAFLAGFVLGAGHYITVDTDARTVYLDGNPAQSRLSSLDWSQTSWQWIPPQPSTSTMALAGTATSGATQVTATWNDGYLS